MNIKNIALVMLVITIALSGCKKIEEALDVKFESTFQTLLNIDVPEGSKSINGSFNESATIDPGAVDDNMEQYLNLIKEINILELSGLVISTSKDVNVSNLIITVASASKSAQWTFANIAVTQGATIALDNTGGQWDTIDNILTDLEVFTVTASGTTDEDDVQFTIQVTIRAEITANPLN